MSRFFRKSDVRMQYEAPSFLSFRGKRFLASSPQEAREIVSSKGNLAVVFVPGPAALSSPRAWASAFAQVDYLIVLARECEETEAFMKALDRIVFSPVARRLSSAMLAQNAQEAGSFLSALSDSGFSQIMVLEGGSGCEA